MADAAFDPDLAAFLTRARRLRSGKVGHVSETLGVPFRLADENFAYRTYETGAIGAMTRIWLREPLPEARFNGLVTADIASGRVSHEAFLDWLGRPKPQSMDVIIDASPPQLGEFYAFDPHRLGVTSHYEEPRDLVALTVHIG